MPLEEQRKEVVDLWGQFRDMFPTSEEVSQDAAASPTAVPTLATLHAAVLDAQTKWETRKKSGYRKIKDQLLDFSHTLHDHAYLFKFIPMEDKYVSLFAGVISAFVKVSYYPGAHVLVARMEGS